MRLAWITDPHLNFVRFPVWEKFVQTLVGAKENDSVEGLLISGDISEAEDVAWQLDRLQQAIELPCYFVLGNHDFYHGEINSVRATFDQQFAGLKYLTGRAPIEIGENWVLCGDDGWADGREGNYFGSPVRMNDFELIEDLKDLDKQTRLKKLKQLGTESARRLRRQLEQARKEASNILVLTHVPPMREACWYEGQMSSDDWAPFFVCHAIGWMLCRFCKRYSDLDVLVLCGHTHHGGLSMPLKNLKIWTGTAEYGNPSICSILDLADLKLPEFDWISVHCQ